MKPAKTIRDLSVARVSMAAVVCDGETEIENPYTFCILFTWKDIHIIKCQSFLDLMI